MSEDAKTLIDRAVRTFLDEVPALAPLTLVVGIDLHGRGDTQQFRLEMPDIEVRKDIAADARVRIEMRREFFNAMVEHGARVADWREAFIHGHAKATGVEQYMRLIVNVVERQEERSAHAEGAALSTPAADGFRMPAEWAPHERTHHGLAVPARAVGRPARPGQGRLRRHRQRRRRLRAADDGLRRRAGRRRGARRADRRRRGRRAADRRLVAARQRPDLRRSTATARAPACTSASTRGARSSRPTTRDAAVGGLLIDRLGDRRYEAPFVLEGGSIAVDGEGTLLTTEQCLLHPNRNPALTREEIEQGLRDFLGVEQRRVAGPGPGRGPRHRRPRRPHRRLHAPGEVLLQSTPPGTPSSERTGRQPLAPDRRGPRGRRLPDPARRSRSAASRSPWAT